MTTSSREPADVLPYTSYVYERHRADIDELAIEAGNLRWIYSGIRSQIFGANGIVCDRSRGDNAESVSSIYFKCAVNLRKEEGSGQGNEVIRRLERQRELVEGVLALRLSITYEQAFPPEATESTPFDLYQTLISELELYCDDQGIPSVLPNLYLPSSLASQLKKEQIYKSLAPDIFTMFEKLALLLSGSTKHLHVIINHFAQQQRFGEALSLLQKASDFMGRSVLEMCADNEALMEMYVDILFQQGEYKKIVNEMSSCMQISSSHTIARERYIQAYVQMQDVDGFMAFVQTEAATAMLQNLKSRLILINACVELGWILFLQGAYQKILDMIQPLASKDARPLLDHIEIRPLIEQANEMIALDATQ